MAGIFGVTFSKEENEEDYENGAPNGKADGGFALKVIDLCGGDRLLARGLGCGVGLDEEGSGLEGDGGEFFKDWSHAFVFEVGGGDLVVGEVSDELWGDGSFD